MANICRNIFCQIWLFPKYRVQIFNYPCIFLALHWKPKFRNLLIFTFFSPLTSGNWKSLHFQSIKFIFLLFGDIFPIQKGLLYTSERNILYSKDYILLWKPTFVFHASFPCKCFLQNNLSQWKQSLSLSVLSVSLPPVASDMKRACTAIGNFFFFIPLN